MTSLIISPTARIVKDGIGNIIKVGWEYLGYKESNGIKSVEEEVGARNIPDLDDAMPLHSIINNDTKHDEL